MYSNKTGLPTAQSCLILPHYLVRSWCGYFNSHTCQCWLAVVSFSSPCVMHILDCFCLLRRAFISNSASTVLGTSGLLVITRLLLPYCAFRRKIICIKFIFKISRWNWKCSRKWEWTQISPPQISFMRSEAFTLVMVKIIDFRDVIPCSLTYRCQCFGGIFCLHFQCRKIYHKNWGCRFLWNVGTCPSDYVTSEPRRW